MSSIVNFFKGKKAFIVGTLAVILGLLNGNTEMVMQGLGIITLRAGIAKV